MKKDTIYIDAEDDITAVVGKVKSAENKVVALVPPKRTGILQSAVNLRLLARVADQNSKHLVLVTGNQALIKLAGMAGIPSARTLQSKPVLPPTPEQDDSQGEEIIDGSDLSIGEHINTSDEPHQKKASALAATAVESTIRDNVAGDVSATVADETRTKNRVKVPNFGSFRKRFALISLVAVSVVGFLVWAVMFAPRAEIVIAARTIKSSANVQISLPVSDGETSVSNKTLKAVEHSIKKEVSVTFEATGEKEVGEKSTGSVSFSNSYPMSRTLEVGSELVSESGKVYELTAPVTVPGASPAFCGNRPCARPGNASGSIIATEPGESYNGATGAMSGAPSGVTASLSDATSGGTDKTVAVVTSDDIRKATSELSKKDIDDVEKELIGKFGSEAIILDENMQIQTSDVKSRPSLDGEAEDGEATLTSSVIYSMAGVERSEITKFLDEHFAAELEEEEQRERRIYDNGAKSASFVDVMYSERDGYTATLAATAQFGPDIDEENVKSESQGKRYGEVQSDISGIPGVESVEINLSPFWVSSVPRDDSRITVEFKLNESE